MATDINELRAFIVARPFRPFSLTMKDGTSVAVTRPLQLALALKGDRMTFADDTTGGYRRWETSAVAHWDLLHIAKAG